MNTARNANEWQDVYGGGFAAGAQLRQVPVELLDPWTGENGEGQPFHLYTKEEFDEMVESVRRRGIITPLNIRPLGRRFQILAGHNRCAAAKALGLRTVPALVADVDDAEATLIMVDSNLKQRQKLTPSEKAKAYLLRAEAQKKKAGRPRKQEGKNMGQLVPNFSREREREKGSTVNDENNVGQVVPNFPRECEREKGSTMNDEKNMGQVVPNFPRECEREKGNTMDDEKNMGQVVPYFENARTTAQIGAENGESYKTVQRYIRLNKLIPELLEMTDDERLKFVCAVELSYLSSEAQRFVLEELKAGKRLTTAKAKNLHSAMPTTKAAVRALMGDTPKAPMLTFKLKCSSQAEVAALASNADFQAEAEAALRAVMERYM